MSQAAKTRSVRQAHARLCWQALREPSALATLTPEAAADFVQIARCQRLLPWLMNGLDQGERSSVLQPAVRVVLDTALRSEIVRTLRRQAALLSVLARLQALGIPVLLLKGAHLATAYYARPQLRPMGDVDLLVPRDRLLAAWRALLDAGCRPEVASHPVTFSRVDEMHQLPVLVTPEGLRLELHWTPFTADHPAAVGALPGLWSRAVPVQGLGALGLAPEDLLLHLVEHAASHHAWSIGMYVLIDIRLVLATPALNCAAVLVRAAEWGLRAHLAASLLLQQELGWEVPSELLVGLHEECAQVRHDLPEIHQHFETVRPPGAAVPAGSRASTQFAEFVISPLRGLGLLRERWRGAGNPKDIVFREDSVKSPAIAVRVLLLGLLGLATVEGRQALVGRWRRRRWTGRWQVSTSKW